MTNAEYKAYQSGVDHFFKTEGITNLSMVDSESEAYFSWSSCDCCNRKLAGDRYDCNGYNPDSKEVQEYSVCVDCLYYSEYGQLDDQTMLDIEESN